MKRLLFLFIGTTVCLITCKAYAQISQPNKAIHQTQYVAPFDLQQPDAVPLEELQCPIPMKDRVFNGTGIQCCHASVEALGRWAEEPKLTDPPLTTRPEHKSYSSPGDLGPKLKKLGVKFEQTYGNREKGIAMIKKAMAEGRGCLFDVPGHAMVLVHYDEEKDMVCWFNNSNRSLNIQKTDIKGFNKMWDTWVLVIYADNDIIPYKVGNPFTKIPIVINGKEIEIKGYIPLP